MRRRLIILAAIAGLLAAPSLAFAQTAQRIELTAMMGRWYEVARLPTKIQAGCDAGTSDWTRARDGFSVVQACRKGAADGPLTQWRARAKVADPATNTRIKMTFFGGMISQEYLVLDHRVEDGWLILATANGKYLWLMSRQPTLPPQARAIAIGRIRQLGFDPSRLHYPPPAKG
jgi:apolipoprotein D and lipocalin family protein